MPLAPKLPLAQIVVMVSVTKTGSVGYSYTDPLNGTYYSPKQHSNSCVINALAPFQVVYALDYQSTLMGWRFRRHVDPRAGSRLIPHQRAANRLSMTTMYKTIDTQYSFYLLFQNKLRGLRCYDDPQEGNIPPPQASSAFSAPTPTPKPQAKVPAPKKKTAKS
ncbi:hypothetical protein JOD97_001599 [Duganella sp. 1411]|uniref:hypothetical protein n=1 Tax=Duganella sp. 1411 TaxID=2806572 RepID=UPI001AE604A5|nr:hypothetical protein [Duganella sp. 1411]MBP1203585.1 hypothetical protein [Duganella sp. 1411]